MSEEEAHKFCDALKWYVQAVISDATAAVNPGDSCGGCITQEPQERRDLVAFLTGKS